MSNNEWQYLLRTCKEFDVYCVLQEEINQYVKDFQRICSTVYKFKLSYSYKAVTYWLQSKLIKRKLDSNLLHNFKTQITSYVPNY